MNYIEEIIFNLFLVSAFVVILIVSENMVHRIVSGILIFVTSFANYYRMAHSIHNLELKVSDLIEEIKR